MKQTNINIDEIKRFPTVTNPIKADDLHTPQAYAYTLRRAIVTDCNDRQRAELVELLEGKESAEGVTFNNTKANRDRLHIWQNSESRKERAAILGEGWQYVEGLNHGTQPGDVITCTDGTRGRVTQADPESCVIEFETEDGHRLTVAGYFRYTPSAKLKAAHEEQKRTFGQAFDAFFIAGKKYRCIKDVKIKGSRKITFKTGKVYEQTNEPTYFVGWLRNEQNDRHAWPQPVYIPDTVKTWGSKPEDIDPRLYFEPVKA